MNIMPGFGIAMGALAAGFSPADFGADLVAWYDAKTQVYNDAGSTLATDGQTVQQWNDLSGNGAHLKQSSSGNQPTYRTTAFNGLPTVEFIIGGSSSINDNILTDVGGADAGGGDELSMFCVIQMHSPTNSNGRCVVFKDDDDGDDFNTATSVVLLAKTGSTEFFTYRNNTQLSTVAVSFATNYRYGVVFDGADATAYLDNVAETPVASTGNFGTLGRVVVGRHLATDGAYWDGYVSEIVLVKRALTTQERNDLDDYFVSRWGL